MRDDMEKVIVERPRWGSHWIGSREGRHYRASEDVPSKQGMRQGYKMRKDFNENLNPLRRYLESQVNRPWDKVYAELCANIDRRNTVQEHIFSHIDGFVERHTRLVDGEVHFVPRYSNNELEPVRGSNVLLYVHPRTGILLRNRLRKTWADKRREAGIVVQKERDARRRVLSEREQLHCVDGIWYHVELAPLPECEVHIVREGGKIKKEVERITRWDVLCKAHHAQRNAKGHWSDEPVTMYGRHGVYAVSKRQL